MRFPSGFGLRRWILAGGAALGLAASCAAAAAPKVRGLGVFSPEDSVYEIAWKRTITTTREGAEPETLESRQRLVIRIKPEDPEGALRASATGDATVFVASVERVAMGVMRDGDFQSIERPKVTLEMEPDTPVTKSMGAIAAALGEAEIRLFVVPGKGVARVGGVDALREAAGGEEAAALLIGILTPAELGRALTPIFSACGGAEAPDPSKGWKTEETTDLGAGGALRIATSWRPVGEAGPMTRFAGETTAEIVRVEKASPGAPQFSLDGQRSPSALEWDGERDLLIRFTQQRALVAKATLGGVSVSQKIDAELSVSRAKQP